MAVTFLSWTFSCRFGFNLLVLIVSGYCKRPNSRISSFSFVVTATLVTVEKENAASNKWQIAVLMVKWSQFLCFFLLSWWVECHLFSLMFESSQESTEICSSLLTNVGRAQCIDAHVIILLLFVWLASRDKIFKHTRITISCATPSFEPPWHPFFKLVEKVEIKQKSRFSLYSFLCSTTQWDMAWNTIILTGR